MDKNAIKTFAIESRRQMILSVKYQASLIGITADGIEDPISRAEGMETYDYGAGTHSIYDEDIKKRESLVQEIQSKGFDNVIEEVAYTWFNRIIAIRFMEVNDYLPTRTRVLSSELEGKIEPDIVTEALDLELDYSLEDKDLILKLKDENKLDELFRFLFIKQCNKLNEILPGLFEQTDDYMELLLSISFTDETGVIRQLLNFISEEDFGNDVEIMGWLYQFYNSELKDETFKNIKKNKVSKERIPCATQIFTPDWIVKYMVENSVGKLWLEGHYNLNLKSKWRYYIEPSNDDQVEIDLKIIQNSKMLNVEDILIIDPCMGSGHILVYIFDLLMDIYVSEGYTVKDASVSILKNNIYGFDIDKRAYQFAYFAIMMKARSYNRIIFDENVIPRVYSIEESNGIDDELINILVSEYPAIKDSLLYLMNTFYDAKIYGSMLKIKLIDYDEILEVLNNLTQNFTQNLKLFKFQTQINLLKKIVYQAKYLAQKYHVVVTNPPYMSITGMSQELRDYLNNNYPMTKMDLFSVFIEKGLNMVRDNGFSSIVTMQSWMFLASYEKLRRYLSKESIIINLLHMDNMVMGIAFGTSATVFRKLNKPKFSGIFNQVLFKDITENGIPFEFPVRSNRNTIANFESFFKIPGHPIAYWIEEDMIKIFSNKTILSYSSTSGQTITANNDKYLRYFWEVDKRKINKENWAPYAKGGSYRKWAGNLYYVVDWTPEARYNYKKGKSSRILQEEFWFKKAITWGLVTSDRPSFRVLPEYATFDKGGSSIFINDSELYYYFLGLLNSNLFLDVLSLLNPTVSVRIKDILSMPVIIKDLQDVTELVKQCYTISNDDWDDYENSLNFLKHPFLIFEGNNLYNIYENWESYKKYKFDALKKNEIRLNELFSEIYNVNFDVNVEDKYVSVTKANYGADVKSFISYAVGCMFGRYSLDNEGLQFAGGIFDLNNYSKFIPDDDNIIPVLDTEYFDDDIVGRFVEFVKVCFGAETLEDNLDFIAGALKKKGKTSREIIRNYFLTDFFKNHSQSYQKRPIYWQFDSGKQNAFKCLVYMHRYEPDLVARVRTDYLHKTQKAIEQNLTHCENIINNSTNKSEVSNATKDKSKYIKQLEEIKVYDEALRHMATQNIEIDLDDGVKVNYAKFQKIEISKEGEKTKKINLLKKI